ncbi:MAG: hypothetical protein ABR964_06555 [Tepidisphaeraceae bacterium]|jgi:hypothetical protein
MPSIIDEGLRERDQLKQVSNDDDKFYAGREAWKAKWLKHPDPRVGLYFSIYDGPYKLIYAAAHDINRRRGAAARPLQEGTDEYIRWWKAANECGIRNLTPCPDHDLNAREIDIAFHTLLQRIRETVDADSLASTTPSPAPLAEQAKGNQLILRSDVARRLKIDPSTVTRFVKDRPDLRENDTRGSRIYFERFRTEWEQVHSRHQRDNDIRARTEKRANSNAREAAKQLGDRQAKQPTSRH